MKPSLLLYLRQRFLGNLAGDLVGALVAAIVALPLCLALGVASGLGAAAGLYGAVACGIFAALFGGTPGQCSGPTGPMTVVAAGMVAVSPNRTELVFAAVICAGIIQLAMGRMKAGQLVHYIPYPVISGFMTGIGAIIIMIQLHPFFGLPNTGSVLQVLEEFPSIIVHWNRDAIVLGACALLIIYIMPLISKRIPATLVALVIMTWWSNWAHMNVPYIGNIPTDLPLPHVPLIDVTDLDLIGRNALTLAVLGAIDTLLTSRVLDKVMDSRHDSDQELVGQGIGNIVSGFIGGLPGAGATMRSMVNVGSGGKTYLSGLLHGVILLLALIGLNSFASLIPLSTLAAILISVGISIMDWRILGGIRKAPKTDTIVMLVVLALTVFVDLITAVLTGIALASFLFAKQLADAKVSSVGDLETLEELRELANHLPEEVRKSIYSYQFNGPLFFGEAKNLSATVDTLSNAKYIILRFYNVPLVDQTGAYSLESAVEKWESRGIKVLFVGMQPHIRQALESTGVIHKIDIQNCFDQFEDALEAIDAFENKRLHGMQN